MPVLSELDDSHVDPFPHTPSPTIMYPEAYVVHGGERVVVEVSSTEWVRSDILVEVER